MGRPRKPANQALTHSFQFKVDRQAAADTKKAAKIFGTEVSTYLRHVVIDRSRDILEEHARTVKILDS